MLAVTNIDVHPEPLTQPSRQRFSAEPPWVTARPVEARPIPHPTPVRVPRRPLRLLAGAPVLVPGALAILAEADLEEHEARGGDAPEPDQHQGQDLPRFTADHRSANRADDYQQPSGAKRSDSGMSTHSHPG